MDERTLLKKTIEMIDGAYAPSTIRAYRGNFEKFIKFCDSENIQALPAHATTVSKFIQMLTKSGLKSSSIRLAYASISTIHKLNELPDPTLSPIAKLELRRMHRIIGRSSKQAMGITAPILQRMLASCNDDLRGIRNRALLMLAYETLCRRSELISLRIEDIEKPADSETAMIKLRKSKSDQDSIGAWLKISQKTYVAIANWLLIAGLDSGFIFRGISPRGDILQSLKPAQINRIYKRIAINSKLSIEQISHISGHSIRVGATQDLLSSGYSLPIIMKLGRWAKPDTAIHYARFSSISVLD